MMIPRCPVHTHQIQNIKDAVLCESVESGHSAHDKHAIIQQALGITKSSVRMDSCCKYMAIARGTANIYLRLPKTLTYEECVWDHAAGYVIAREAGGVVRDVSGNEIDFSTGRTLKKNKGFIVCAESVYPEVETAVTNALSSTASI